MATQSPVRRGIERPAISRVLEYLHQEHQKSLVIVPLVELSEATSIDPNTAEAVMERLEETGPFDVEPLEYGEIRWRIEGSAYDIGGWENTNWNLDRLVGGAINGGRLAEAKHPSPSRCQLCDR